MIGNKQRLPTKGMLLSHQKECLLQDVFDTEVLFKTRKTTSELCFVTYLRFHLVECTRVYVTYGRYFGTVKVVPLLCLTMAFLYL